MGQGLARAAPLSKISHEAHLNEVFALVRHVLKSCVVEVKLTLDDIVDNLWLGPAGKWDLAREHDVEDDAH